MTDKKAIEILKHWGDPYWCGVNHITNGDFDDAILLAIERISGNEKEIPSKVLEETRDAFIAFCHNIINGMYVSVVDAAKEQLEYLETCKSDKNLQELTMTCKTCKHRQRWMNEFSPKVTQVCELQKGRTSMGFKKIKVTDPACIHYEKED